MFVENGITGNSASVHCKDGITLVVYPGDWIVLDDSLKVVPYGYFETKFTLEPSEAVVNAEDFSSTKQEDKKYRKNLDIASTHEEEDLDEVVPIDEEHLAWDVIPATEPVKEIAISTILKYLEDGFNRGEIAIMLGHSLDAINKLFKKFPVLHNRKPAKSNRLPFKVVEDIIKEDNQQSLNLLES